MTQINITRSLGTILLAVFLILTGLAMFGIGPVPAWFMGLLAIGAGLFLLLGI